MCAAALNAPRQETTGKPETHRGVLRFMTCGSVDDGKSTLIGRMLYDLGQLPDDQLSVLESDSGQHGTVAGGLDFALLVDGLQAEREQGITIDVAYRFFSSPRRKLIVADAPGHEQYTRNMATAASVSELAIVVVDARKGIVRQTRRHCAIAHFLGIRHIVLAINKMDLVGFSADQFGQARDSFEAFAAGLGVADVKCIPVVARDGDNIVRASERMRWYTGPTIIEHLEAVDPLCCVGTVGMAMPVQWVNRPDANYRGFSGSIASGEISPGSEVLVLPSGSKAKVRRIDSYGGPRASAQAGDAVTLVLTEEVDISRGDVIVSAGNAPEVSDQLACHLVWLGEEPMLPGRPYLLKCATQVVSASVTALKHHLDVNTLQHGAGRQLEMNEIAFCNLSLGKPIVFRPYEQCRTLGAFILIDKITNQTVGAGMTRFALRRSANVRWQSIEVDRARRAAQKGQAPFCLWLTGLSGSGKSTIANAIDQRLFAMGHHSYILDGDNVRHGLNRDLGFTNADRVENIRRAAEVARLMVDAGLVTIVSFISPFRSERQLARELIGAGEFLEVFVDTPLEVCEARDPKGLYKRARSGEIKNFTGLHSAYEAPTSPDIRLAAGERSVEHLVELVLSELQARRLV